MSELYGGDGSEGRARRCDGGRPSVPNGVGVAARTIGPPVRRAHDCSAAAPLERQPQGDARAAVHAAGSSRALLAPSHRRRHAVADGARLDRSRGGERRPEPRQARPAVRGHHGRDDARRSRTVERPAERPRAALSEGEARHPAAGSESGVAGQCRVAHTDAAFAEQQQKVVLNNGAITCLV